jgi:hypothetical protein
MSETVALDKTATFEARWDAMYALTWKTKTRKRDRYGILLKIALDESESTELRKEALVGIAQFHSTRGNRALLPTLQDENAPSTLREEVAHILGMSGERRAFAVRALMEAWKTAPPTVRVYIAYAFACIGHPRFIPLLRESVHDLTMSDLRWTLAQECRWAITCCRKVRLIGEDGHAAFPDSPAFLSPTWERETQYLRAKGRSVRPR